VFLPLKEVQRERTGGERDGSGKRGEGPAAGRILLQDPIGVDAPGRNARKFQRNPIYTTLNSTFSGLYNSVADNTGLSPFV